MFVLNSQKLQPFDVLLVRFPGDENSLSIRQICNSQFSHAAVYIGNHAFIEGISPVVLLFSAERYFFPTLDDVRVIRLKQAYRPSFDTAEAENTIRSLAYCNYSRVLLSRIQAQSLGEDVKTRFLQEHKWTGGVVCSTLVSLPFYAGGIDISQKKEPFFVHFGDIERAEFFEDVTSQVFEETAHTGGASDYFTASETGSIQEKQSKAVGQLNILVSGILNELRQNRNKYRTSIRIENQDLLFTTWEDIIPLIMKWFATEKGKEIDELVYDRLLTSGYTKLWFDEVHSKRQQFFPAFSFIQDLQVEGLHLIARYQATRTALDIELKRNEAGEEASFHNFSQAPAKTLHALVDMYRSYSDLLRSSVNQYDILLKELR